MARKTFAQITPLRGAAGILEDQLFSILTLKNSTSDEEKICYDFYIEKKPLNIITEKAGTLEDIVKNDLFKIILPYALQAKFFTASELSPQAGELIKPYPLKNKCSFLFNQKVLTSASKHLTPDLRAIIKEEISKMPSFNVVVEDESNIKLVDPNHSFLVSNDLKIMKPRIYTIV